MRFVIYGAGAIGGVVGARLASHGHDVVLIARGAHRDAIAARGLRIESPVGTEVVPMSVVGTPGEVGLRADDLVLMAMKTHDTIDAAEALAAVAPPDLAVVATQNGVESERILLRRFANVYGICVMMPASHLEPGVVQAHSARTTGILDIGRYPSGVDELAAEVAAALRTSTFSSEARADVMRWKYCKLLMNLGNAVEAVCVPSENAGELTRRARREGIACLRAAGLDFASLEEDQERRGDLLQLGPIDGAMRAGGSSWQSLARGAGRIETDYLTGEIVLLGRLHDVPTPANSLLQTCAARLARARAAPGSLDAAVLLAELGQEPAADD